MSKDIIGLFEIIPNSIGKIIIVIITNKSCYIIQIVSIYFLHLFIFISYLEYNINQKISGILYYFNLDSILQYPYFTFRSIVQIIFFASSQHHHYSHNDRPINSNAYFVKGSISLKYFLKYFHTKRRANINYDCLYVSRASS